MSRQTRQTGREGRLPWGAAWGRVGYARASTSDQTSITAVADVTGCSVTFTAIAGRQYEITGYIRAVNSAGTPAFQQLQLTDSTPTTLVDAFTYAASSGNPFTSTITWTIPGLTPGSTTLKLRFGRAGADAATYTISNSSYRAFILVKDIGPA